MRLRRRRLSVNSFELLKIIGRGAFGEVIKKNNNNRIIKKKF